MGITNEEHGGSKRENITDGVAESKRDRVSAKQLAELKEACYGDEQSEACKTILVRRKKASHREQNVILAVMPNPIIL